MYQSLFIGNQVVKLDNIDSTNSYAKKLLSQKKDLIEGLVVFAKHQTAGKGQMGNKWLTEGGKNLTFSIVLKPKLSIDQQFMISKAVSLGIVDFLRSLDVDGVSIKWPNDIYVNDFKIAGILIENTLKGSIVDCSVVGVGLNVNQIKFNDHIKNATSIRLLKGIELNLDDTLKGLLFFIEKRYLVLRKLNDKSINDNYLLNLYRFNEIHEFEINEEIVRAKIKNVARSGKLILLVNELVEEFDLKELKFVI